jgi:AraC family transcriptional regulator of adaptative response / DNA-3-methyladenine glycosylase II
MLDFATCDRARLARDRRYDGAFFTGVCTTGIYCRPVCPVKPAKSANVRFFPSAGFRPCLRCRPEAAPGSPAWRGTGATIARAVRLIEAGFLDAHGVPELAARLGIGTRHLARLFKRHLGAPPSAVAATRRIRLAKRLLDETATPIAAIAFAAGFRSLRRFNAVFARTYRRPPSALRRARTRARA